MGNKTGILTASWHPGRSAGSSRRSPDGPIDALAAVAAFLFAVLLHREIRPLAPRTRIAYPVLIASVGSVAQRDIEVVDRTAAS